MTKVVRIATFLAIGFILVFPAFSQQPTANLNGTIVDPNGAVIPNATVTVIKRRPNRDCKWPYADKYGRYHG
jgi:hypothetical protein